MQTWWFVRRTVSHRCRSCHGADRPDIGIRKMSQAAAITIGAGGGPARSRATHFLSGQWVGNKGEANEQAALSDDRGMTPEPLFGAIQLPDRAWVRGRGLRDPAPAGPSPTSVSTSAAAGSGCATGTCSRGRRHGSTGRTSGCRPTATSPSGTSARCTSSPARASGSRSRAAAGSAGTGTVIACLASSPASRPTEAVGWARANYHARARSRRRGSAPGCAASRRRHRYCQGSRVSVAGVT